MPASSAPSSGPVAVAGQLAGAARAARLAVDAHESGWPVGAHAGARPAGVLRSLSGAVRGRRRSPGHDRHRRRATGRRTRVRGCAAGRRRRRARARQRRPAGAPAPRIGASAAMTATSDAVQGRRVEHDFERYRVALTRRCTHMLGSRSDAEDAVQETLLRAWRHHERFQGRCRLDSWLHRIATNVCVDMLNARSKRAEPVDPASLQSAPLEVATDPTPTPPSRR